MILINIQHGHFHDAEVLALLYSMSPVADMMTFALETILSLYVVL